MKLAGKAIKPIDVEVKGTTVVNPPVVTLVNVTVATFCTPFGQKKTCWRFKPD